MRQRRLHWLLVVVAACWMWSCQQATQPTDLAAPRTVALEVLRTNGEPIVQARVDWQKLSGPSSPVGGSTSTGADGTARIDIPSVSTTRDLVSMLVTMPPLPAFAGIDPIEVRDSVCNDTTIAIGIAPLTRCGTPGTQDTMRLEVCAVGGIASKTLCRYYPSNCPTGLVFSTTSPVTAPFEVTTRNVGTSTSMLEFCATYTPPASTPAGTSEEITVTVEGRLPGSAAAIFRVSVLVQGRVDCSICPCPQLPEVRHDLGTVCIGTSTDSIIPLSRLLQPLDLDPDCHAEFELLDGDGDGLLLTGATTFTVRGGSSFPDLPVNLQPTQSGRVERVVRYRVTTVKRSTGQTNACEAPLSVRLIYNVEQGQCRIVRRPTDTLEKCVFMDSSTTETISIENTGNCPITINVRSLNGLFGITPDGDITIPAGDTAHVVVGFAARKLDWDANPANPRGSRGDKDFSGDIVITGCGNQETIRVHGIAYVQCNAFKYQCLRQFRPPGFDRVYAESIELVEQKTQILYQNDNQAFKVFDIYVRSITPNGATWDVELATGVNEQTQQAYGAYSLVTSGFAVLPGQNICDTYPANASQICSQLKNGTAPGTPSIGGLRQGDVILYVKNGQSGPQCALIWIQSVGPDRPGPNSLPQVCIEICYPVFAL